MENAMTEKKLFAVYVGGEMQGANIEVHDMRLVLAEDLEGTYPLLRVEWWGIPKSLHIDCWAAVDKADGYRVSLRTEPSDSPLKLYFVNLGGYDPAEFAEMHRNVFVVAETESKAKVKALKTVRHWRAFHRDDMYEVEQSFCISKLAEAESLHIHLEAIEDKGQPDFICQYKPIGKKAA